MARYRDELPQLAGGTYLADGGVETDLIFNRGIEIREFAAHTLLPDPHGRARATELDAGNPLELAGQYVALARKMPWVNVFGGCCGSDLRHVTEIARALAARGAAERDPWRRPVGGVPGGARSGDEGGPVPRAGATGDSPLR